MKVAEPNPRLPVYKPDPDRKTLPELLNGPLPDPGPMFNALGEVIRRPS